MAIAAANSIAVARKNILASLGEIPDYHRHLMLARAS
jgi:hypothetical protein